MPGCTTYWRNNLYYTLTPISLEPDDDGVVRFAWEELAGSVQLLDENGRPMAGVDLRLKYAPDGDWPDAHGAAEATPRANAEGQIFLELLEGRYVLTEELSGVSHFLDWSPKTPGEPIDLVLRP